MVIKCSCKNDYQDQKHGATMRVFNPIKSGNPGMGAYRCTICKATAYRAKR